jgi:heme A synthase
MSRSDPRAKTTIAAAALMLALTALFGVIGVELARRALDPSRIEQETYFSGVSFGLNAVETRNLVAMSAILVLVLVILSLVLVIGVLGRRASVRHGAIGTFIVFAAVTLPLSIGEIFSEDPEPTAAIGLLIAAVDIAIVALLLRPETLNEFERAEAARERVRAARRAERVAGRNESSRRASETG